MFGIKYSPHAEVAELADALGSGLSGRKLVRVQVPPSAHLRIPAERQVSCLIATSNDLMKIRIPQGAEENRYWAVQVRLFIRK